MYIAVDDTDSVRGNCTTFLATEIIRELSDLDLIGNPRLVRLNPATPWKTRGNGALVIRVGKGLGERTFIGNINGKDIFCYDKASSYEPDAEALMDRLIPIVRKNSEKDADPGLVLSIRKPSQSFYWKGVRTIVERDEVEDEIRRIGAEKFEMGCGRGVIGCTCGMAWRPRDSTLELLAYRSRERWGTEREFDPMSIRETDMTIGSTFNSWEEKEGKVTMVPSTPCPVLYGLRGDDRQDLLRGYKMIRTEEIDRWLIFLTNQGTDDHIIMRPRELVPDRSYYVEGTVTSKSRHMKGGHTFIDIDSRLGNITLGAYEPSKEFRRVLDGLIEGDRIGVTGELRADPRTLNIEKLKVIGLVAGSVKVSNPLCFECGRAMESVGKDKGYRCRRCHTSSEEPIVAYTERCLTEGWYEPPASARRHLSKPLKRMGVEQPVEFVDRRM